MTDWAIAVEEFFGRTLNESVPGIQYRSASSYEALERTWGDERKLPSREDLEAAYAAWVAREEARERLTLDDVREAVEGATTIAGLRSALLEMLEVVEKGDRAVKDTARSQER